MSEKIKSIARVQIHKTRGKWQIVSRANRHEHISTSKHYSFKYVKPPKKIKPHQEFSRANKLKKNCYHLQHFFHVPSITLINNDQP